MDKILSAADSGDDESAGIEIDELIFEEATDENNAHGEQYNQMQDEGDDGNQSSVPEIRLKHDLNELMMSGVNELKDRIVNNNIEFKLLRAIHIL